jgi:hypothetical protein
MADKYWLSNVIIVMHDMRRRLSWGYHRCCAITTEAMLTGTVSFFDVVGPASRFAKASSQDRRVDVSVLLSRYLLR